MGWRIGGLVVTVVVALLAAWTGRALARSPWEVTSIPGSRRAAGVGEHPVVAAAADGWAVLTWDGRHHKFVALKAPGASRFGVARAFARGGRSELGAAVDGRGQAVVAWLSADEEAVKTVRVGVGGVGPVVRLSPFGANLEPETAPLVALGSGGRAAVVWFMFQPAGAYVNLASPGRPFRAPQLVDAGSVQGSVEEGVYAGFDASGRLHVTWQESEGALRGTVWSRDGGRRAARTLLPLGPDGAQPAPRALDVATLASGGQLAILGGEAGALLSRQPLGGVFGPLVEQPVLGTVDRAVTAVTGWTLLASSGPDKRDQLSLCPPMQGCSKPEVAGRREELRTLAIGPNGDYVAAWEGSRGARESGRLVARLGHGARLGRRILLATKNFDEQVSSAVTADGEALLAFAAPGGIEVARRPATD